MIKVYILKTGEFVSIYSNIKKRSILEKIISEVDVENLNDGLYIVKDGNLEEVAVDYSFNENHFLE